MDEKKNHFLSWGEWIWSYKYTECIVCHTTDYKHCGKWVCHWCYDKKRGKYESRKKKHNIYAKRYIEKHPEIVQKCRKRWDEWTREVADIHNCLRKGKYWEKHKKPCIYYKNRPIPLDITSKDKEIQALWKRVKDYIDNRKCGKKV